MPFTVDTNKQSNTYKTVSMKRLFRTSYRNNFLTLVSHIKLVPKLNGHVSKLVKFNLKCSDKKKKTFTKIIFT